MTAGLLLLAWLALSLPVALLVGRLLSWCGAADDESEGA